MNLMDLDDTPFVLGVFVAPLIVVVVFTVIITTQSSRRIITTTSVLSALVVASLITYWAVWGAAFDEVDAGREVPSEVDLLSNIATGLSAVSAASLLALSAALLASKFRRDSTPIGAQ